MGVVDLASYRPLQVPPDAWQEASMEQQDWQRRARCRGLNHDQFFVRGSARSQAAIDICNRCRVRSECLEFALENELEFGIWGGMTERQRRRIRRRAG